MCIMNLGKGIGFQCLFVKNVFVLYCNEVHTVIIVVNLVIKMEEGLEGDG